MNANECNVHISFVAAVGFCFFRPYARTHSVCYYHMRLHLEELSVEYVFVTVQLACNIIISSSSTSVASAAAAQRIVPESDSIKRTDYTTYAYIHIFAG